MWNSIHVYDNVSYTDEPGGLVVINGSLIEDAEIAITSISGGNFFIQNSTLNANNKHLHLHGWGGHVNQLHRSFISNSNFTCNRSLISPYAGRRTSTAITVSNVYPADRMAFSIGGGVNPYSNQYTVSSPHQNTISDCDRGIHAYQTDLTVNNTHFEDIYCNPAFSNPCLIPDFNENPMAIRYHGNGTHLRVQFNTFDNIHHGIMASSTGRTIIHENQFTNLRGRGVFIYGARSNSLQLVEKNLIEQGITGVYITASNSLADLRVTGNTIRHDIVAIQTDNNSSSYLDIRRNNIFNPGPINWPSSRYNCGIWVNESVLSSSLIAINNITSRYYGIHSFGGPVLNERILRNTVNLVRMVTPTSANAFNYGIVSRNRDVPILIFNYTKGEGISQQLSSASRLSGIILDNTNDPIAHCNEMDNTYTGMIALGDNTLANLQKNIMRAARVGFLFKGLPAIMGATGAQGSNAYTHDNEWHCPFSVSALRSEDSQNLLISPFYVQNSISPYDPGLCTNPVSSNSLFPASIPIYFQTTPTSTSNITCFPDYYLRTAESDSSSEFEDREIFDPVYGPDTLSSETLSGYYLVATDSLEYGDHPEFRRLMARLNLFQKLSGKDSLRTSDSIFSAFYTTANNDAEGAITRLLEATGHYNMESGADELQNWTPDNAAEEFWWNWFDIQFRMMNTNADTLTSGLKDTLVMYASLCPDTLGYPVYAARSILLKVGLDSLITLNECEDWTFLEEIDTLESSPWDPENTILLIYPNPANIEVIFEHDLEETENTRIKVYDSMGNLKYNELFSEESRTLLWDSSSEISGMYYVILVQNDVVMDSKSLAIIH